MADPNMLVPLSTPVQNLLDRLCAQHNQPPLDLNTRRILSSLGETESLRILQNISRSSHVRSLSGYIHFMIRQSFPTETHNQNFHPLDTCTVSTQSFPPSPSCIPSSLGSHDDGDASSPIVRHHSSTNMSEEGVEGVTSSSVLSALGELEFRKAFLLLNYIGKEKLEKVVTASQIQSWKALPMDRYELKIWEEIGQKHVSNEKDRIKSVEWDSGKTHVYHCHVSTDGSLMFKGPYLQNTRTLLQKVLGDDNVLMVKFAEDTSEGSVGESNTHFLKLGKDGITIGLRIYKFLVFKDGGKEEKKKDPTSSSVKCYFVRMSSTASVDKGRPYILSNKTVREARAMFMHVQTISNISTYMARFSLILSKTLTMDIDFATVNIEIIEDIICLDEHGNCIYDNEKPRIHTDGTGFISEDLALLCPRNVSKGKLSDNVEKTRFQDMLLANDQTQPGFNIQDPPLLIQCRLFHEGRAIKGTLLTNKELPIRTIQARPSMVKVHTDASLLDVNTVNSLEIVGTSNPPKKTYLSRNLIALLSYGGVSSDYFMNILENALEDARGVFTNKRTAVRVSMKHGELDDFNVARMILSGVPLEETFLQWRLSILAKEEMKGLKEGRLHIPDCYYLMGTVDPTGCLAKDQVCIILDNGQISGDVLVYRNPGLHFGDIHVLRATYVKELESFVGNCKYGIFFPVDGPRSLADEIAGGDFDGDMYFISRNAELLRQFRKSDPWIPDLNCCLNGVEPNSFKNPRFLSDEELEKELFQLFLSTRFKPSYAVGVAADSWLALMDRLLTLRHECEEEKELVKRNVLQLVDVYYNALDAPKKGGRKDPVPEHLVAELFPHYLEKRNNSYTSKSILGLIYDKVSSYKDRYEETEDVRKLPCFDVIVPPYYYEKWRPLYEQYKKDMTAALDQDPLLKNEIADGVINKYKQILYEAPEHERPNGFKVNYQDALAIYHITYDHAKDVKNVKKCGFAWKVAGSALAKLYLEKQGHEGLTIDPFVLRDIQGW